MPKQQTDASSDFAEFLHKLGLLHDCTVTKLKWDSRAQTMTFDFRDLHFNFEKLPEYRGPIPGRIVLEGARIVEGQIADDEGPLRIYEFEVIKPNTARISFSPGGHIVVAWERATYPTTVA